MNGNQLPRTPSRAAGALLAWAWLAGCGPDPGAPPSGTGGAAGHGGAGGQGGAPYPTVPVADCGRVDLRAAQPAVLVDGVAAVPVDLDAVSVTLVLDAAAKAGTAQAAVAFTLGGADGNPVLDLRQGGITALALDGAPVDPGRFTRIDFGGGADAELRWLAATLPACSPHTLDVSYPLGTPLSSGATGVEWDPAAARVRWNFSLTDYVPGWYLEKWAPANLIHDQFALTFDLTIANAETPHAVVTNGAVEEVDPGARFRITFPATTNAMSPMLIVLPADELSSYETVIDVAGQLITVSMHKRVADAGDLKALAATVAAGFAEFTASTGPYAHGDRFTVFLKASGGMEYDGAALTEPAVLTHELFHSWYGRGVRPARGADGWIDEAWNEYNTTPARAFKSEPLDPDGAPLRLCDDNPWTRDFPKTAYGGGSAVFAGLAAVMGVDALRGHMAVFYQGHMLGEVTTEDLERHLACASGHEAEVRAIFHRFVYGRSDEAPAPGPGDCP
jgi:hypothetical protein